MATGIRCLSRISRFHHVLSTSTSTSTSSSSFTSLLSSSLRSRTLTHHHLHSSFISSHRHMSTSTTALPAITTQPTSAPSNTPFVSRAIRDSSSSTKKSIFISPRKLNDICRLVRGLSVDEAIAQCKFSGKPKAIFVSNAIKYAAQTGVVQYQMDKSRLYVALAVVGKDKYFKRADFRARGRVGLKRVYRARLTITVREQPYVEGERRIGRAGRTLETIQCTKEMVCAYREKYPVVETAKKIRIPRAPYKPMNTNTTATATAS